MLPTEVARAQSLMMSYPLCYGMSGADVSEFEIIVGTGSEVVRERFSDFDSDPVRDIQITSVPITEYSEHFDVDSPNIEERLQETAQKLKTLGNGTVPDPEALSDEQQDRYEKLKINSYTTKISKKSTPLP